jgi:hypothetical protein
MASKISISMEKLDTQHGHTMHFQITLTENAAAQKNAKVSHRNSKKGPHNYFSIAR